MKANLLLCLLPCLIESFEIQSTGIPPIATPFNDSTALINYQDTFKIKNFSQVYAIEVLNNETKELFVRLFQYELVEGEGLIVGGLNLSQCQTYKSLVVRIIDGRNQGFYIYSILGINKYTSEVFSIQQEDCSIESNTIKLVIVTTVLFVLVALIICVIWCIIKRNFNKKNVKISNKNDRSENHATKTPDIKRRPGTKFDPYYDYDDPDVQRIYRLPNGDTKEWLNETTYEIRERGGRRIVKESNGSVNGENDYSDENDSASGDDNYYKDNDLNEENVNVNRDNK